ncbi:DUF4367 domain-containing protein [Brevibacillus invocatus]|uniref:DUF4367 domain-containing protein n=1 Tax=Brevibacillus invocatus TaxID=173959 RepID=A0A3M8CLP1_9BACL|nr:DUF4367 domain-containing protein [Brevibacillus invocatus]RNB76640.1 DUF4367 domain-containing protein [Brevibacillus invocatus]
MRIISFFFLSQCIFLSSIATVIHAETIQLMMSLNQKKALFKELDSSQKRHDNTELVQINNCEGHFEAWVGTRNGVKDISGGYLHWIHKGTYVEMVSSRLSKEEMIKIAKSLK